MIGSTKIGRRLDDFFFQAEDGIRDTSVTGVQTCALPISLPRGQARAARGRNVGRRWRGSRVRFPLKRRGFVARWTLLVNRSTPLRRSAALTRSEERRVGKECRYQRWTFRYKENEH